MNLSAKKLSCALIGCGGWCRYAYVPALNQFFCPFVCTRVFNSSPDNAQMVADQLKSHPAVENSIEDVLMPGIDAAFIVAPNHLHYAYSIAALDRKIHVLCEKPIANSLPEAENIKKHVELSGCTLAVGFNQRYTKRVRCLQKILNNGKLGVIHNVNARFSLDLERQLLKTAWYSNETMSGGGILHNAGVHLVNLLINLFGEVRDIQAKFENRVLPNCYGEDIAHCDIHFISGATGRIDVSAVEKKTQTQCELKIEGSKGVLESAAEQPYIIIRDPLARTRNIRFKMETSRDSVFKQICAFHRCITEGEISETGIDDSIQTARVIAAAYLSAQSGARIFVK